MKALLPPILTACLLVGPAQARYGGGTGEPNDPYLIYTAAQLNEIGLHEEDWDKHFKLMADISLAAYKGTDFNIIGKKTFSVEKEAVGDDKPFTGVFDGNDHTISDFTYDCIAVDHVALFRYVMAPNAEIRDLGLIDPNVRARQLIDPRLRGGGGSHHVGSLVAVLGTGGVVTNCYVEGGSVEGAGYAGGLVGSNVYGMISACHSAGNVSGDWQVGGLVGDNLGTITNCHSAGNVSGDSQDGREVGGLVGTNAGEGAIRNCSFTGEVSGDWAVGGLVGANVANDAIIGNCYAMGTVSGKGSVGGLAGCNGVVGAWPPAPGRRAYQIASIPEGPGAAVWNCYATGSVVGNEGVGGLVGSGTNELVAASFWDIQTSGQTTSEGGSGRTTAEMQTAKTFLDAGWDFAGETANGTADIWWILEGKDYPRLWWELPIEGPVVLVVDDFESYTDDEGNRIFDIWMDGYTNGTGATVGDSHPPFVYIHPPTHSGEYSMPFEYNNVGPPYYSEAYRTWDVAQDWTIQDIETLTLYIRGRTTNQAGPLYVAIEDGAGKSAVVIHPDSALLTKTPWTEWRISVADFAGTNTAAVQKMYLGVGDRNRPQPNGTGTIWIDDIYLTRRTP